MSHEITEIDKGYVWGTTWHGMPQYITKDVPVTEEEAKEVLAFETHKAPLYRKTADGQFLPANAWEIVRTKEDITLVDHVGRQFDEGGNLGILTDYILPVMKEFPSLKIESVGTLWSGGTCFVNLKVAEHQIKGDKSQTVDRVMWYNPMGHGGYKTCAHSIRVVCNNTLRAAGVEGKNNGSLITIKHSSSADRRIGVAFKQIAQHFLELESQKELLLKLTGVPMNSERIKAFMEEFIPIPANAEDRAVTMRTNNRDEIMHQFESDQALDLQIHASGYAMLQAVTYVLDHEKSGKKNDVAAIVWDGIIGGRSDKKLNALNILNKLA